MHIKDIILEIYLRWNVERKFRFVFSLTTNLYRSRGPGHFDFCETPIGGFLQSDVFIPYFNDVHIRQAVLSEIIMVNFAAIMVAILQFL